MLLRLMCMIGNNDFYIWTIEVLYAIYKDSVELVMAELDSIVAKARRDILPLVEQLNKTNDEMLSCISYGDAILYDLQREIFKDNHSERDVMYDPNGRKQDVSWAVDSITEATADWIGE